MLRMLNIIKLYLLLCNPIWILVFYRSLQTFNSSTSGYINSTHTAMRIIRYNLISLVLLNCLQLFTHKQFKAHIYWQQNQHSRVNMKTAITASKFVHDYSFLVKKKPSWEYNMTTHSNNNWCGGYQQIQNHDPNMSAYSTYSPTTCTLLN